MTLKASREPFQQHETTALFGSMGNMLAAVVTCSSCRRTIDHCLVFCSLSSLRWDGRIQRSSHRPIVDNSSATFRGRPQTGLHPTRRFTQAIVATTVGNLCCRTIVIDGPGLGPVDQCFRGCTESRRIHWRGLQSLKLIRADPRGRGL